MTYSHKKYFTLGCSLIEVAAFMNNPGYLISGFKCSMKYSIRAST